MIVKCNNCGDPINTAKDKHAQMGNDIGWSTFYICEKCHPEMRRELARQQKSTAKRRVTAGARA